MVVLLLGVAGMYSRFWLEQAAMKSCVDLSKVLGKVQLDCDWLTVLLIGKDPMYLGPNFFNCCVDCNYLVDIYLSISI